MRFELMIYLSPCQGLSVLHHRPNDVVSVWQKGRWTRFILENRKVETKRKGKGAGF